MDGPGLWAMSITMLANGSFFLSYLFGWFYLWTVSPEWRMPEVSPLSLMGLLLAGGSLTVGAGILEKLISGLRQQRDAGLSLGMFSTSALGFLQVGITLWVLLSADLAVTENSHDAIIMVGLAYALFHGGLGAVLTLLQGLRVGYGYVGAHAPFEPAVVAQLWRYNVATFWIIVGALAVLPRVIGS